jgi:hypothetical protein
MNTNEFNEFINQFQSGDIVELEQLLNKVDLLTDEQKIRFKPVLDARTGNALNRAKGIVDGVKLALKIEPVTDYISIAYLSRRFFGKSRSWLHNRLMGYKNNGKPDTLSDVDIHRLQEALFTISDEIKAAALRLS